mgnify:CR=1 FL=1|tara:strand:+ start:106 stop:339 length:234 start_codon:yes stop_codon:yes gene_type:complete
MAKKKLVWLVDDPSACCGKEILTNYKVERAAFTALERGLSIRCGDPQVSEPTHPTKYFICGNCSLRVRLGNEFGRTP